MRTNIDIDDELMAAAMAAGGFKTKKQAVEEGLRLLRRREIYDGLLALRGKLQWDDSEAGWAHAQAGDTPALNEPAAAYRAQRKARTGRKTPARPRAKSRATSAGKGK